MPRNIGFAKGYAAVKNRRFDPIIIGTRRTSFKLNKGSNVAQEVISKRELQAIINKLKTLPLELQDKELKKILRKNAKRVVKQAKSNIPKAQKDVHRYQNGKIVETHKPGTLRKSIGVLPLRRTSAVYVGPRAGEKYKNNGWFGHFLELGTVHYKGIHYMEKAYNATKDAVLNGLKVDVKTIVDNWTKRNRI